MTWKVKTFIVAHGLDAGMTKSLLLALAPLLESGLMQIQHV